MKLIPASDFRPDPAIDALLVARPKAPDVKVLDLKDAEDVDSSTTPKEESP